MWHRYVSFFISLCREKCVGIAFAVNNDENAYGH